MPLCVSRPICVHIHQNASKCVVPSMNHRDLFLAGGVSLGQLEMWLITLSLCPPPPVLLLQRTCSFGGFDLSNRSLHVVGAGSESNVSASQFSERGPSRPFLLLNQITFSHFNFFFRAFFLCSFLLDSFSADRTKTRSPYTERWSNRRQRPVSRLARRSSRSKRR